MTKLPGDLCYGTHAEKFRWIELKIADNTSIAITLSTRSWNCSLLVTATLHDTFSALLQIESHVRSLPNQPEIAQI
jgi:hypothetical protein